MMLPGFLHLWDSIIKRWISFFDNRIILKFRKLSERPDMREKTYSFTIEEIPIIVTKKRMKNMYLRISKEDGSVRISAPHQMSDERIYRFCNLLEYLTQ